MKIAIASAQVPFIRGGAEIMTDGLVDALQRAGHQVETVHMPFYFGPAARVLQSMDAWSALDFNRFDCGNIDVFIPLKFPAFYAEHPNKRVWLMHQHRSCYELWNTPNGESSQSIEAIELRDQIFQRDARALRSARKIFTISKTVSDRMMRFNGIESNPILQPPANADLFGCGEFFPYIFVPSRLESLKRQHLIIQALSNIDKSIFLVIAGEGGQRTFLNELVERLGLQERVIFTGKLSDDEMRKWYSNCLAVFFGPLDEDYGFITLEAMLSSKAVITCSDSGGPLYFVTDGDNGMVCEPQPDAIAIAVNYLCANRKSAREMGRRGSEIYSHLNIGWDRVVDVLLAN